MEGRTEVWRWDLQRIDLRPVTDNVAELLANKMARLAVASSDVLKWLACMGNDTSAEMLSIVLGLSMAEESSID